MNSNLCLKHNKPILKRYNSTISSGGCLLCIIDKEKSKDTTPKEIVKKTALKRKEKGKPKLKLAKADKEFSIFIRQRDADHNGVIRCISCGAYRHWKKADNGHYIKRQHMATRFDEINCNAQCKPCNGFEQGNNQNYRLGLIKKYGLKAVEQLELKEHTTCHMSQFDIDQIEKYYKEQNKLKSL